MPARSLAADQEKDWRIGILGPFAHDIGADGFERRCLMKIDDALGRIEAGNFGICEICEEEISIKRLEARPVTTMCIRCKEEQEKQEKSYG